jgi:hypothetical protein
VGLRHTAEEILNRIAEIYVVFQILREELKALVEASSNSFKCDVENRYLVLRHRLIGLGLSLRPSSDCEAEYSLGIDIVSLACNGNGYPAWFGHVTRVKYVYLLQ